MPDKIAKMCHVKRNAYAYLCLRVCVGVCAGVCVCKLISKSLACELCQSLVWWLRFDGVEK